MSAINMQDGFVKSPLVQGVQQRDATIGRAFQDAQAARTDDLTRQAEETIHETTESEQEGIRDEQQRRQQQRRRKAQQGFAATDEDETLPEAAPTPPTSRMIDITV